MPITRLAILLLCSSLPALAFGPHTAHYQLSIGGIPIAKEVRTLHQLPTHYFYTANAQTSGPAALIKDYQVAASASFNQTPTGLSSVSYQIMEREDGQVSENYAIDVNPDGSMVRSLPTQTQPQVQTWQAPKSGHIVDPLTLFLAISHDLETGSELSYQVADGKSLSTHRYQVELNHPLQINQQTVNTTKVSRLDNERQMSAYFVGKYHYLPVLIQQQKNNKTYRYELTRVQFQDQPEHLLKVTF